MIKNNIEIDIKKKYVEEGITQVQLAEMIGTSALYVNRVIKNTVKRIHRVSRKW